MPDVPVKQCSSCVAHDRDCCWCHHTPSALVNREVSRAFGGSPRGDHRGECITWRGHSWHVADASKDGDHVHLTLTRPEGAPWSYGTTNDG